jgi:hypothetical protein
MQLDQVLFTLPIPIFFIHLGAIPIFAVLLWKRSIRAAAVWVIFLVLESIVAAFVSVYAGGMFGLGSILVCLTPFTIVVSLLLFFILLLRIFRVSEENQRQRRFYLVGGLFIVALQIVVFAGHFGIQSACFAQTRGRAAPVIDAVETYRQANGSYPQELGEIVPSYLPVLPSPSCGWLRTDSYAQAEFALERCEPDITLLTVDSLDGEFIRRYNFATGSWSSVSFLDGTCSYLR